MSQLETIYTYSAPRLKLGPGAAAEIGPDLAALGVSRALVVTDPGVAAHGGPQRVAEQLRSAGLDTAVYDQAHVEPTDASLTAAVDWARKHGPWDGFVAVGGGSSIDTAKAINLLTSNDGELMDYVNAPVGGGRAPTAPLHPLVAVPTTTGTGAESTTVCVLDVLSQRVKTGISHEALRPRMAVVDPDLTITQPSGVTASAGMDILCHALESYTAKPYSSYPKKQASQRVPYCGANPIADMWAEKALTLMAGSFRDAVRDGHNVSARYDMTLAATFAGLGFGNAGVHVPHANAYPIAGQVKDFHPDGYPQDEPMVPHGMSVALTAPAAFRMLYQAGPDRQLRAAWLLAPDAAKESDPADQLASVLTALMRDIGIPNGLEAIGYTTSDIPALVDGSLKQQRLLTTAPRPITANDLAAVFQASMRLW